MRIDICEGVRGTIRKRSCTIAKFTEFEVNDTVIESVV